MREFILCALMDLDIVAARRPIDPARAVIVAALLIMLVVLAGCDARNTPTPTTREHALTICPTKANCLDMPRPTAQELEFTK